VQKATLQTRQAAEYIGISYWKLLELAKAGLVPHIRIGGRLLFRRETLDVWLEQQERASLKLDLSACDAQAEPEPAGRIRRLK